jgi:uncharacterized membrane protein
MNLESRTLPRALAAAVLTVPTFAAAQDFTVMRIDPVPGAFSTLASGLNDQGRVVGHCQFFDGGPQLRAWVWSETAGLSFLPQPPGLNRWVATDVNEAGVIRGDGGYDFGQAWRYDGQGYELLGSLPGGDMSTASTLDEAGVVAGTSRNSQSFLTPPQSFAAVPGQPLAPLVAGGFATHNNDLGQVVGYASNKAYLTQPGGAVTFLGPLGTKPNTWAWSVNAAGTVVGEAAAANGNGHVPFRWTAAGGMQEIGNFGGSAAAVDVNDGGAVVGNSGASVPQPWLWREGVGLRFLGQAIDPAEQLGLLSATRINDAGQILGQAIDQTNGARFPVLLTPIPATVPWSDLGLGLAGTAGVPQWSGVGAPAPGGDFELHLGGAAPSAPSAPAFLAFGSTRVDLPLLGGTLVPDVTSGFGGVLLLSSDGTGSLDLAAQWPLVWPTGALLYTQVWVLDAGAPGAVSASNGLVSPAG